MRKKILNIVERSFLIYIPILIISIYVTIPILWTLLTSFKIESDIMKKSQYLPTVLTFENYKFAWVKSNFSIYFKNTVIISALVAVFVIIIAVLAAYGLSRFKFKGRKAFILIFLITQLIPGIVLIIPFFMIFKNLGLMNTLTSLVVAYITMFFPFSAILMMGFLNGIPVQLEEAAMIDGCGRLGMIFRVVLPLLMPGIVAVGSFAFLNSWNEFIYPIMFISSEKNFVISIGLSFMLGQNITHYGALAAGSIIALSVPLLIYVYMQKHLVMGLSSGAVKG